MSVLARPEAMLIELEGHDGSWWTLAGDGEGREGIALGSKVEGIWDDPFTSIWNQHAFQIGATFGGVRTDKRDIDFVVHGKGTADDEWEIVDSNWRKAWHKKKDSRLWISSDYSRRYLPLRISETPEPMWVGDPQRQQYAGYLWKTVAGWPRWIAKDRLMTLVAPSDTTDGSTVDLVDEATGEQPLLDNPTDVETWPIYELQAYPDVRWHIPDYSHGDDRMGRANTDAQREIVMPPLLAGEHVRIDTDPTVDQVTSSLDTAMYIRMQGVRFVYPLPEYMPPTNEAFRVSGAPAGIKMRVRLRREWSRPIGLQ